jgi:hypothetical protein
MKSHVTCLGLVIVIPILAIIRTRGVAAQNSEAREPLLQRGLQQLHREEFDSALATGPSCGSRGPKTPPAISWRPTSIKP